MKEQDTRALNNAIGGSSLNGPPRHTGLSSAREQAQRTPPRPRPVRFPPDEPPPPLLPGRPPVEGGGARRGSKTPPAAARERAVPRRGGGSRRKLLVRIAFALAFFALGAGAVVGYIWWRLERTVDELNAGPKQAIVDAVKPELGQEPSSEPQPREPEKSQLLAPLAEDNAGGDARDDAPATSGPTETFLLIGSDRRWGEQGGRSDTIILARLDPQGQTLSLLSVPRDLRVPIPGHGEDKVNAAFAYGGERLLVETLREFLDVRIDHFFEVNFASFGEIVGVLDGVYLPIDGRYLHVNDGSYDDNWSEIDLEPGYQRLTREQVLSFVRFRHYDSDFHRAARQQLFLREAGRQALVQVAGDFGKAEALLKAVARASASDIDSIGELWKLYGAVNATPSERILRLTVPGEGTMLGGIYYLIPDELEATLALWRDPQRSLRAQEQVARTLQQPKATRGVALLGDAGAARALVERERAGAPAELCVPGGVPPGGYAWSDSSRSYRLNGEPALALVASAGSGRSLLLMQTAWQDPPTLTRPTKLIERKEREYELYLESGKMRQIAWWIGETRVWLVNTLRNELSAKQMLALAESCNRI